MVTHGSLGDGRTWRPVERLNRVSPRDGVTSGLGNHIQGVDPSLTTTFLTFIRLQELRLDSICRGLTPSHCSRRENVHGQVDEVTSYLFVKS